MSSNSSVARSFEDVENDKFGPSLSVSDVHGEDRTSHVPWWRRLAGQNDGRPKEKELEGWKPLSMTTPILGGIAVLSLLIAAAIEILAQRSQAQGGLALSPTQDDIPDYAMWSYLYGPNVVAVLYSLIWSWVDLDVKRMQPWLELSKAEGATTAQSLFLDYPYDFVAVVPWKAARQRQWGVFLSGLIMMIIFWVITPLQSAILGLGTITKVYLLDTKILNTAYAIAWLDQPYPPFMRTNYATLPFYVDDTRAPKTNSVNWTAATTKIWTELECWPANIFQSDSPKNVEVSLFNGQSCNTTITPPLVGNNTMLYMGYYSSPFSANALASPQCNKTADSVRQFLAVWIENQYVSARANPHFNVTALYCQPHYYKQHVEVSISSATLEPIDGTIIPLGKKTLLGPDEFNNTAFEYLLGNGMPERTDVKDFPFNTLVSQQSRLENTSLSQPVPNMVGYALAGNMLPIEDYSNPAVLQDAFSRAHQHLFSSAVSYMLLNATELANQTATTTYSLAGVVVSRPISSALESLLVLVAIKLVLLNWICGKSPCKLRSNPSSIGRLVEIFRSSPELTDVFKYFDVTKDKHMLRELSQERFRLVYDNCTERERDSVYIEKVPLAAPLDMSSAKIRHTGHYRPIKPFALRFETGLIFVTVISGTIAILAYFKWEETQSSGLRRPTQNFEVLQLLENYLPTIFATLIEPFWVLLNRMLCMLQPFKDLWEGKSHSAKSVGTTYTSIPPQLTLWRAMKSGHFALALVCTICLLANVLSVSAGALFNEAPVQTTDREHFRPTISSRFDNASVWDFGRLVAHKSVTSGYYSDPMYVTVANVSSGTRLPPWLSTEYFFQPHTAIQKSASNESDTYVMTVRGFGAHLECKGLRSSVVPFEPDTMVNAFVNATTCSDDDFLRHAGISMRYNTYTDATGVSAIEYGDVLNSEKANQCNVMMTFGWGRMADAGNRNSTIRSSFAMCTPSLETAMFQVKVDSEGHVLSYRRVGNLESTLDYQGAQQHIDMVLIEANHLFTQGVPGWHNDTHSRSWPAALTHLATGSRSSFDPQAPVPDPMDLIPSIRMNYRRVFASILSMNTQLFEGPARSETIMVSRHSTTTRIFLDSTAFIITVTILGLNILVAVMFYMRGVAFVLPRMPTTIGSVLAYLASSRAMTEKDWMNSASFSFGRYIGHDGLVHIGVEADPYVVPIPLSSLQEGSTRLRRFGIGRLGQQRRPISKGPWL